ncbi:MAG: NAD(P)H-hydrate epimerase, partial [Microbacterium sp.]|nr:NAD(P)H-hydrate epimerase [Microbacterium sp.]
AALRGGAHDAVTTLLPAVRSGRTRVVAVDLPSGVQPDDGSTADGVVLPASVTVTFGGVKAGLAATRAAGRVVLVELGLPLDPATAVGEADVEIYRA